MTNSTATSTFSSAPLSRTDFVSWQDAADEFAKALQNQQIVVPAPDQTGTLKKTVTKIPLSQGITLYDTLVDLSDKIVNLVSTGATPTVGILTLGTTIGSNAPGVAIFTAALPDATYTLVITAFGP